MTLELATVRGLPLLDQAAYEIGQAPATAFYWLRDAMLRAGIAHRREFLRRTGVRVNRRPSAANPHPILAPRVGEIGGADPRNDILWVVTPPEERRRGRSPDILRDIGLHIFTDNPVLEGQEVGGRQRPKTGSMIAVPISVPSAGIKRSRRSPAAYRRRFPKAVLLARRSRSSGTIILFERIRKRTGTRRRLILNRDGTPRARQPKTIRDKLLPRWVLLPAVNLPGKLEFFSTWDALAAARNNFFGVALDRIVRDVNRGIRD